MGFTHKEPNLGQDWLLCLCPCLFVEEKTSSYQEHSHVVAVLAALCGSLLRRKTAAESDPKEKPDPPSPLPSMTTTPSLSPEGTKNAGNSENEQQIQGYLLSLLPAMKSWHNMSHSLSNINHLPRSSSVQKLKSSLGTSTILRSMLMRKNVNRNNNGDMESVGHNNGQGGWSKLKKEQEKLKPDDSLWMKTIILGETCKVLEDDEVVLRQQREEDLRTPERSVPFYGSLPLVCQIDRPLPQLVLCQN